MPGMNYENEYEKEIDLKDLIFYVLYKWRQLFLAAVLLGLLLGGYKVASGLMVRSDSAACQELQAQYEEDKEEYEKAKASGEWEIEQLQTSIASQEAYLEESILMNLDAYEKPEAVADFFVKLDEAEWSELPSTVPMDPTDSVVKAYASNLERSVDWDSLSKKTGRNGVYLKEATSVEVDYDSNTFTITVAETTETAASALLDEIVAQIQSKHGEIARAVGAHSLVLVNKFSGVSVDQNLADNQKRNRELLVSYQRTVEEKERAVKELKEPEVPAALSNVQILKSGIKFGVIGIAAGIFLMAFFWAVVYVLSDKLRTEDEMKAAYGIPVLGVFSEELKRGALDRWMQKLSGKRHDLSDEVVLNRAAVTLRSLCPEGTKLLITGSIAKEKLQEIASSLTSQMHGVEIIWGENTTKSLQTLEQIPKCDAVILVEQRGVSACSTIEQEKELVESLEKKIMGCIVL